MVPRAVLMKSGLVSINTARQNISKTAVLVNTARQVNAAHSKTTINAARPMLYLSKTAHSTVKRSIHKNTSFKNSNINQRVNNVRDKNFNTARPKEVVNAVKGNNFNGVKASACWVWKPKHKDQGMIDSGCSRHMTGNMSYLTDYEEIDGGYVAFGGILKGGKITGKATPDESKLWHRRLGHLNFKTMNKLVKGNLVRGLPSKLFENDQTCVACQKGKQHRASCKSKTENSISLSLHLFHIDLVGPTFVKSLMKKMYYLVVTYDYSRFTWVFFLATKDETSGILKSFINGIENLVDHNVTVIRCDNEIEFKNREMNQFCEMKGILRQKQLILLANRVLAVKPHNKTPYEIFHGRTPTLSFMRPFGYPVTILNTIDHLGKFDGKADEGSGPDWLFDIDALTRTMNYEPIVADTTIKVSLFQLHEFIIDHPLDQVIRICIKLHKQERCQEFGGNIGRYQKVDLPNGKRAIGSKWILRNKKDERGIVIRNKARLVAQGYTQEEGIDYDEMSPPGFEDPDFPDRVYKVEKALYGLHQAPRAWYETLSTYLLDNGFQRGKIDKTLFIKRHKGDILLSKFMWMISSLVQ
ncbi:putative ribonuclease H-like domain-containing protein [Tanacetum coccineum]